MCGFSGSSGSSLGRKLICYPHYIELDSTLSIMNGVTFHSVSLFVVFRMWYVKPELSLVIPPRYPTFPSGPLMAPGTIHIEWMNALFASEHEHLNFFHAYIFSFFHTHLESRRTLWYVQYPVAVTQQTFFFKCIHSKFDYLVSLLHSGC